MNKLPLERLSLVVLIIGLRSTHATVGPAFSRINACDKMIYSISAANQQETRTDTLSFGCEVTNETETLTRRPN